MVLFGHQIIDENADISLGTVQNHLLSAKDFHRSIYTCHKALYSCFLITGASVKLTACKQAADLLKLQCRLKLQRIDAVILNGISISHDTHMFQSRYSTVHCILYILRKRTAHSA